MASSRILHRTRSQTHTTAWPMSPCIVYTRRGFAARVPSLIKSVRTLLALHPTELLKLAHV